MPTSRSDAPPDAEARSARVRLWLLLAALVVGLIVWGAGSVVTVGLAYQDLQEARRLVADAEGQLRDAELTESRTTLEAGVAHAGEAATRLHRPYVAPLRLAPVIGPNLRTATALSDAAHDVGTAAVDLLAVAQNIVHDERDAVVGEVSVDYLGELAPPLRSLAATLERTTTAVQDAPDASLLGPVASARATYLDMAVPATGQARTAADLAEVLPAFLGDEEPRRYLLAAGALSELRASGGLMGSWALLTADGGHLDIGEFRDVDDLAAVDADVSSPSDEFAERYARFGSLRQWRNANLTPDFPSAAKVMLELWEAQGGEPLDGVIMADTVTFARLSERAGGLEIPGGGRLEPQDTLEFVGLDAYAAFEDDEERKLVLGAVAAAAFGEALEVLDDGDVPATVEMLGDLADGGHLRIYSTDGEVQPALERAGVGGQLPDDGGELAGVVVNNVAGNKVDWFTHRKLEHQVRLLPDGQTTSTISVTFDNDAPAEGHPRAVLGPWTDHTEAGDNLSLVSFLCSSSCEFDELPAPVTVGGTDGASPIADLRLLVPAGERRAAQVRTRTDDAWQLVDGDLVLSITHPVQPTLHGSSLRLRVALPDGWEPAAEDDAPEVIDGEAVWEIEDASGTVQRVLTLQRAESDDA